MISRKKHLVMLVHHEPNLDPRIKWEADSASSKFEVTVLGFSGSPDKFPQEEKVSSYRIIRIRMVVDYVSMYIKRLWSLLLTKREKFFTVIQISSFISVIGTYFLVRKLTKLLVNKVSLASKLVDNGYPFINKFTLKWIKFVGLFGGHAQITATLLQGYSRQGLKADIIHCNDLETLLAGVYLKLKDKCRLVYDAHELWPASHMGAPFFQVRWFRYYEKRLIKYADEVLTVSPQIAQIMKKWYGLKEVRILPNAEPYYRTVSDAGQVSGYGLNKLAKGRVKFLAQGFYGHGRGFEKLIQAWRLVDHSKAVLFLRGPHWSYVDELKELAGRYVDKGGIYFLDPVTEDELISAAKEADIGLIPYEPVCINHKYCCPNKLSVYMQAGLAIITNELPFVKELIEKHDCGLAYDYNDEESMITAFNRLIEDKDLLEKCKKNSLKAAREEFNWQKFSHVLLDAYGD